MKVILNFNNLLSLLPAADSLQLCASVKRRAQASSMPPSSSRRGGYRPAGGGWAARRSSVRSTSCGRSSTATSSPCTTSSKTRRTWSWSWSWCPAGSCLTSWLRRSLWQRRRPHSFSSRSWTACSIYTPNASLTLTSRSAACVLKATCVWGVGSALAVNASVKSSVKVPETCTLAVWGGFFHLDRQIRVVAMETCETAWYSLAVWWTWQHFGLNTLVSVSMKIFPGWIWIFGSWGQYLHTGKNLAESWD